MAVVTILNLDADKIPPEIKIYLRTGIESHAALLGIIQTENIGFEKVDCNIVTIPVTDFERAIKGDAPRICCSEQNDRHVAKMASSCRAFRAIRFAVGAGKNYRS